MILEKTIRAGEPPKTLCAGIDPNSYVHVFVHALTENGFTEECEQGVLDAEREAAQSSPMPIEDFIKELKDNFSSM